MLHLFHLFPTTRPTCLYRKMSWSEDVPSSNRCSHRAPTLWQRNYTLLWVCQKVLRVLMVCLADATLDLWCNHRLLACNPGFFASSFRIFEKWYLSEVKRAEFWTEKPRHRPNLAIGVSQCFHSVGFAHIPLSLPTSFVHWSNNSLLQSRPWIHVAFAHSRLPSEVHPFQRWSSHSLRPILILRIYLSLTLSLSLMFTICYCICYFRHWNQCIASMHDARFPVNTTSKDSWSGHGFLSLITVGATVTTQVVVLPIDIAPSEPWRTSSTKHTWSWACPHTHTRIDLSYSCTLPIHGILS